MKIASFDDVEIAYFDFDTPDSTKTILLVHGFASTAKVNWVGTGWVKTLNDAGYRVIAHDNRGHGQSTKFYRPDEYGPDIFANDSLRLLDHLGIERCDVLGYSMGARITCWICHEAPQRVRRAVFGGMGSHIFGNRGGYIEIAEGLETDDPSTITDRGAFAFRKFADATKSDRLALAACIRPSKVKITEDVVRALTSKVLVAVGSNDEVGGSSIELADMMPNAEAYVIEGMDHMKATGATAFKDKVVRFLVQDDS